MPRFLLTVIPAILAGGFATGAAGQASLQAGAYSEGQAVRGQVLYYQHCLACHGEMMNGVDQAPPLAGPQFSSTWKGASLWALVERMQTMPPDKPGMLSRQDNVDILAYMLWYNGFPLGTAELVTTRDTLAGMTFETPPLGSE